MPQRQLFQLNKEVSIPLQHLTYQKMYFITGADSLTPELTFILLDSMRDL